VFRADEEQPGHNRVVILSDRFWRQRFDADPTIIGQTVRVDGQRYGIVGVLPSTFFFLQPDFDMWMPLVIDGRLRNERTSHASDVLVRLAPGIDVAHAQADLDGISRALQQRYPGTNAGWRASLLFLGPHRTDLRPTLLLLFAAVGCVLLIACINVANLLLVRAGARTREMAIRVALGASRFRLVRQMFTESVLLAGIATVIGVLLAKAGLMLVQPLVAQVQPMAMLALDARVLPFAILIAGVTALIFGLVPAIQASRAIDRSSPKRMVRARALLVIEIAASLMLLVTSTLLVRTLRNLQKIPLGFQSEHLLTMQLWLPETSYPHTTQVTALHQEVLGRLKRFPEIRAAALVNTRPFLGWSLGERVRPLDRPPPADAEDPMFDMRVVSPEYLTALAAPLVRGRMFTTHDDETQPPVAMINESLVRRYWPTGDPLGKALQVRPPGSTIGGPWWPVQTRDTFTIVGVVSDLREGGVAEESSMLAPPAATVYLSYLQNPSRYMHLLVRTEASPGAVIGLVRHAIQSVDPDLGLYDERTMAAVLDREVATPRFTSVLTWAFAGLALMLAAIGVFGVTSYSVTQRRRELATRVAVGASTRAILEMITGECLRTAMAGIAVGLLAAVIVGRALTRFLYGVLPTDPSTLVLGAATVFVTTVLAYWRPAWRATRVDPAEVLRCD
jgi:putative ABC transport system permease protein